MKRASRVWTLPGDAGLPPGAEAVLATRGLDASARRDFLAGELPRHDPFALPDFERAVDAIIAGVDRARRYGRPIAIYGDYDADGITATAMLTLALRGAGVPAIPYIPDRFDEGYGINLAALEQLVERDDVGTVVSVDCGTSSAEAIAARPPGLSLVVTDHHLPSPHAGAEMILPDCDGVVNPKRADSRYPFDGLCGAGVAWKLLGALENLGVVAPGSQMEHVALAAIGTVCDMMPLLDENRGIVIHGLRQLSEMPSVGLSALMKGAGVGCLAESGDGAIRGVPVTAADIGFRLGPRINAAGRTRQRALTALNLLLTQDPAEAAGLASELDRLNDARKDLVEKVLVEATQMADALPEEMAGIVLGHPEWSAGIVGLVAGRIAERFGRPTCIVSLDPGDPKGSARSASGVHLVNALASLPGGLLRRFGGHAAAAGFSMNSCADLERLQEAFDTAVRAQVPDRQPIREYRADLVIDLAQATPDLVRDLARLEPCGMGNPTPMLAVLDCAVTGVADRHGPDLVGATTMGQTRTHVRIPLSDGSRGRVVQGIAFNKPELAAHLQEHLPIGRRLDVVFGLEIDEWKGVERVRMHLRDIRPAQTPELTRVDGEVSTKAASGPRRTVGSPAPPPPDRATQPARPRAVARLDAPEQTVLPLAEAVLLPPGGGAGQSR